MKQAALEIRSDNVEKALGPPLKWAGGKRWQVPHLVGYWERHKDARLVEPFCGGLAVTLGLLPEQALLNDVNVHLANFYQQLKRGLVITAPMHNASLAYYAARDRFNRLVASGEAETHEAAALFYYLNRTGFNGLCRFNASGGFNVPHGKYATINYTYDFLKYKATFAGWDFTCSDFARVPLLSGDFVYADPPYDVEFTTYSAGGSPQRGNEMKTINAVRECAEWLATCLRLGWRKTDLDWLEKLWWEHHDEDGHLKPAEHR